MIEENVVYIYRIECHSIIIQKGILLLSVTWMKLEDTVLIETKQAQ